MRVCVRVYCRGNLNWKANLMKTDINGKQRNKKCKKKKFYLRLRTSTSWKEVHSYLTLSFILPHCTDNELCEDIIKQKEQFDSNQKMRDEVIFIYY